jgi:hypothetical protein
LQVLCARSQASAFALVPLGGDFETDAVAVTRSEVRPMRTRADARVTSDLGLAISLRNAVPSGRLPNLPMRAIFLSQFLSRSLASLELAKPHSTVAETPS